MATWDEREPGTYELTQFVREGRNGESVTLGTFSSKRALIEAARAIAPISTLKGGFTGSFKRSNERVGVMVDGYFFNVNLEPGKYEPDTEITLSDGRVVWLGDVEEYIQQGLEMREMMRQN